MSSSAMQAMLHMDKLDIAALRSAADGAPGDLTCHEKVLMTQSQGA